MAMCGLSFARRISYNGVYAFPSLMLLCRGAGFLNFGGSGFHGMLPLYHWTLKDLEIGTRTFNAGRGALLFG
jgi:hypothetical protein